MQIKTGVDILWIKEFSRMAKLGGEEFLKHCFSPNEVKENPTILGSAGIYCAKEAVIKALSLTTDWWQKIEISKNEEGRPKVEVVGVKESIISDDLSISHNGSYVVAVYVGILK